MKKQYSFQADTAIATIAWAQFLVLVSVVPQTELASFAPVFEEFRRDVMPQEWRTASFISLSMALNLVALCFLSIPAFISVAPKHPTGIERALKYQGAVGFTSWGFSFLLFIGYFNEALSIIALLAVVFALLPFVFIKEERPNQPPQRNAGSRPSSGDAPASDTQSSLGPRG